MSELAELAELPPSLAGRFRVERPISRGAFGVVFEATQLKQSRRVALKLLHAERMVDEATVKRFHAEARLTASLSHPHIVRILDYDVDEEIPWIAYELLSGGTLGELIEKGPVPCASAIEIAIQIASALETAHAAGILHRDIKSGNVLAAGNGQWKVTDFGLAKWGGEHTVLTQEGAMMGTPGYMSPELARGGDASPSSDVYALGILLFELLTGAWPFTGRSGLEVIRKHMQQPAPAPSTRAPGVPAALDAVVLAALVKDASERTASATLFRQRLEEVRAGLEATPRSTSSPSAAKVGSRTGRIERPSDPAIPGRSISDPSIPAGTPRVQLAGALAVAVCTAALVAGLGLRVLARDARVSPASPIEAPGTPSAIAGTGSPPDAVAAPVVPAPAAPLLAPGLRDRVLASLDAMSHRRRAASHSFGELMERTADLDSFVGLSPAELRPHLVQTRSLRTLHAGLREQAGSLIAEMRAVLKDPEVASTADLLLLLSATTVHVVEGLEVLRYDKLVAVLERLQRGKGAHQERLEDTYNGLKAICYPGEAIPLLQRHAELAGIVLARAATSSALADPLYPDVFSGINWLSTFFASYTVCGVPPLEVVKRGEERVLARLAAVKTPAAEALADLVTGTWRARSQVEHGAGGRYRSTALAALQRLTVLHPHARVALDRTTLMFQK